MAATQAPENHRDEWGLTWHLRWGIYKSILTNNHSPLCLALSFLLSLSFSFFSAFLLLTLSFGLSLYFCRSFTFSFLPYLLLFLLFLWLSLSLSFLHDFLFFTLSFWFSLFLCLVLIFFLVFLYFFFSLSSALCCFAFPFLSRIRECMSVYTSATWDSDVRLSEAFVTVWKDPLHRTIVQSCIHILSWLFFFLLHLFFLYDFFCRT